MSTENNCCSPSSNSNQNCCTPGPVNDKSQKVKHGIGVVILCLAVVLAITSAFTKKEKEKCATDMISKTPLLTDFNWLQTEKKVAFVFLEGENIGENDKIQHKTIEVMQELNEEGESVFFKRVKKGTNQYNEVIGKAKIKNVPAVLVLGRKCNSSILNGKINSTHLVKAYMAASSTAPSCSPSTSCCPTKK